MTSIFTELKRRNVFKVGIAYGIVAWLLIQIVATVLPMFGAPDWVAQTLTFIIILGFPLAVFLAWAYEITPEGLKPSHQVEEQESIRHLTGRKIDYIIIGVLAIAVIYLLVSPTSLDDAPEPEIVAIPEEQVESTSADPVPEPDPEEPAVLPNSVAVLPLENLSPDPEEAYFATGIHDEILNQLAKLRNLNVIARTSVQQYADTTRPIPEIADELNVETVMEGSIRYADGRVRLVAQLIDAETGAHLWSDAYERDFENIFAIQADIAMNIANALEAEFSDEEQEQIEKLPTDSSAAYTLYLRALEIIQNTNPTDYPTTHQYFDQAIELDPEFALAIATQAFWKAMELPFVGFNQPLSDSRENLERDALEKSARALQLDPSLGIAHIARAINHGTRWDWGEALEEAERAYELSPNDTQVLNRYSVFKRISGDYDEAIRLSERLVELDPLQAGNHHALGVANYYARNYEDAIDAFNGALEIRADTLASLATRAMAQNAIGDHDGAVESLQLYDDLLIDYTPNSTTWLLLGFAKARMPEKAEEYRQKLEQLAQTRDVGPASWVLATLARGDEEETFRWLRQAVDEKALTDTILLWEIAANVWSDPMLEKPEFRELRDRIMELE